MLKFIIYLIDWFNFRTLRSLSSLITLSPDELAKKSIEIDGPVSPFIVLFLMFGHAGSDLASPHVAAGWSNEKITEWLSTHISIKERYFDHTIVSILSLSNLVNYSLYFLADWN